MDNLIVNGQWHRGEPESEDAINEMLQKISFQLPSDYLEFLESTNIGRGDLGIRPGYIEFFSIEEFVETNSYLAQTKCVPDYFAFATNGGGELFMFQKSKPGIYLIHSVSLDPLESILIATSFDELLQQLGRNTWDGE